MPPSTTTTSIQSRSFPERGIRSRKNHDAFGQEKIFEVFCSPQVTDTFEDIRDSCVDYTGCCNKFKSILSMLSKQLWSTLYNCSEKMADPPCTSKSITDSSVHAERIRFAGNNNNTKSTITSTKEAKLSYQYNHRHRSVSPPTTNIYLVPLGRPESFESIDNNGTDDNSTEEGRDDHDDEGGVEEEDLSMLESTSVDANEENRKLFSSGNILRGQGGIDDLVMTVENGDSDDDEDSCIVLSKESWDGGLNNSLINSTKAQHHQQYQYDRTLGSSSPIDINVMADEEYDDLPCRQE